MQVVLHSHYFHLIIVSLVVLDAIIVLFELLLDVGAFSKYYTWVSDNGDYTTDNIECEGEELLEQAEACHYDNERACAAPSNVTPISDHANHLCTCKFRGGKRVCRNCKLFLYIYVVCVLICVYMCECSIVCIHACVCGSLHIL